MQILIFIFAAFALTRAVTRFRQGQLPAVWLAFWVVLWAAVAAAALLPAATSRIAALLGVGRGVDAVIYGSIIFLYYLVFRVFLRFEKMERAITMLVREDALKKSDDHERKNQGNDRNRNL